MLASSAEADPVDFPGTGPPFVPLEFGSPSLHRCDPVALVDVDDVLSARLDFV